MLLALYPDIIKKAFAEYEKRLFEQTLQNEMEKKAAEWDGVIDAVQDSSKQTRKVRKTTHIFKGLFTKVRWCELNRFIIVLAKKLQK